MLISDLIGGYYEKKVSSGHDFGDIYFTEAYYAHQNVEFFRPVSFEDNKTATHAKHFRIQTDKPFQHGIPLHTPRLETDEEFLVVRAKIRPVVLLQPHIEIDDIDTTGFKSPLYRKQSLVAQVFSVHHPVTKKPKFPALFLERIQQAEYKHLLYLPANKEGITADSILRLDACQSVFTSRLKTTGLALHTDAKDLLRSQFQCLVNDEYSGYYKLYRDEILASLKRV
jgi:hypothetical protein